MNRRTLMIATTCLLPTVLFLAHEKELDAKPTGKCLKGTAPHHAQADFGPGALTAAISAGQVIAGSPSEVFVTVDLSAREAALGQRRPLRLAIVIDRSGSMSGDKIVKAREAAQGIIDRLGPEDRVALIQYDDTAQILARLTRTDDEGKRRLKAAISGIYPGGSTNLHAGMALGHGEIERELGRGKINRVVLLSDGLANVGITDTMTLARIAGDAADRGIRTTTVGVGVDFNEDLMEALADNGRGQYYYVKDAASLESVFAGELKAMQGTVLTHAELELSPACGVEILEVYGYRNQKNGQRVLIPLADISGGERRKVVVRVRVPEAAPGREDVLTARLTFGDTTRKNATVAIGVEVSRDAKSVELSVDRDVMGNAVQVESAQAMRMAAEAYDRGDVATAQKVNRENRVKVEEQATKYALPALATQVLYDQIDGMAGGFGANAPGSLGAKDAVKQSKAAARQLSK